MLEAGRERREVDFLVTLDDFGKRLGVRHKLLVVGEPIEAGFSGDVRVLDASTFLAALPV
ncbi:MAG: hypothetical protein JXP73_00940 [Deltaproteobacteria bacterium]|nr:hypothetical protein [Deltaproteobacteria bacterium]